jgi:hypothetical protein
LQKEFDVSKTEKEASKKLNNLADWTQTNKNAVSLGEFGRLANAVAESRQFGSIGVYHSKEAVPANLRTLLSKIYHGHCQVCDFWFLKKDNEPYFEVHHLDSFKGHYPKNIVVVCGNCHNQFEYAKVSHEYDANQWLIKVTFNKYSYVIKQALSTVEPAQFTKEVFV